MEITERRLSFDAGASVAEGARAFWAWWSSELKGMLPQRLRRTLESGEQRVFLELEDSDLLVSLGTPQAQESLAHLTFAPVDAASVSPVGERIAATRDREVIFCLPADKVLIRPLTLPLAAEENLREVLAFEMDRLTPFSSDQVYYDHVVSARNRRAHTLALDLVLIPRSVVDGLLSKLAILGFHPDATMIRGGASGTLTPVNLLPAEHKPRRRLSPRRFNALLGSIAGLLLATAVALPLVQKAQVVRSLEATLDTANLKADVTRKLREKVNRLSGESSFLMEKKISTPLVLEVMNELTRVLPDDTWIDRLEIKGTELQIQGQSSSAAALISVVESASMLHNARFRASVTQVPRTDMERFHLSADIRHGGGQ